MKIEVIKIKEVKLPNGKMGTIMDIEDFKRIISSYELTIEGFKNEFGLSRGLWDNTLLYYSITSQDIFSWRKLVLIHDSLHLNSSHGFSKMVEIQDMHQLGKNSRIEYYLEQLTRISPNIRELWYSKISHNTEALSNDLANIGRELIEFKDMLKKLSNRCRKYAIKNKTGYTRIISSTLENTIAKILDELNIKYKPQYYIKPYHYDFLLVDLGMILEIDGGLHNSKFDKQKEALASTNKFNIIRISVDHKGIKKGNYEDYKNRISEKLGLSDSL